MKSVVQSMLDRYPMTNPDERVHALKQVIQEITLSALSRAGFFRNVAFYGGTALRIFHGLDRFSEDLDFSLLQHEPDFQLDAYLAAVRTELFSFGFEIEVEGKAKREDTGIQSAFIKGGTLVHLVKIAAMKPPVSGVPATAQLKVKLEIDVDPPAGADTEMKYLLLPVASAIRLYDLPSLFAGKLHALLCRKWKNRVKGRDFYDYIWYLSQGIAPNLPHLEQRLRQSGHWDATRHLDVEMLTNLLYQRFAEVDFQQVASEVRPFVENPASLDVWSEAFFRSVSERLQA
jgi:predicted nucleotidyltransferase component of viral defense system